MEGRSAAYRGATRAEVERKYHEAARIAASEGYAPTSEAWSTEPGEEILTVSYAYLPEQAPAVLEALGPGEPLPAAPPPSAVLPPAAAPPPPAFRTIERPSALDFERASLPPTEHRPATGWRSVVERIEGRVPALQGRVPLAAGVGVAVVVVAFWFFVLGGKPGDTAGSSPTAPPVATAQPTQLSKLAASDVGYTASAAVGGNIRFHFTITNHGLAAGAPVSARLSGLSSNAEMLECDPTCTKGDASTDLQFDFADGLTPGQSVTYEINFRATTPGEANWTLTLVEGQSLEIYKGNGSIKIE